MRIHQIFPFIAFMVMSGLFAQNPTVFSPVSVQGSVYADLNNSGTYDAGDVPLAGVEVIAVFEDNIVHTTTDKNGHYAQPMALGNCTVRIVFKNKTCTVVPTAHNLDQLNCSDAMVVGGNDFRILPNNLDGPNSRRLSLTPLSSLQSGKTAHFELKIENGFHFSAFDTFSLKIASPFSYLTSSVEPLAFIQDEILWETPPMQPFEVWKVHVVLSVEKTEAMAQSAQNSVLSTNMYLAEGDVTQDFSYEIENSIGGVENDDIKANSKTIIGDVTFTPSELKSGAEVLYFIRFQNITNLPVNDVTIIDSLDNRLDGQLFEMVAASHPYQIIRDANNVVRWMFNGINLTDTLTDSDSSQGYVLFRIGVTQDLFVGDFVLNKASILLDDVLNIETPHAIFTIKDDSGTYSHSTVPRINVYPNPTTGKLTVGMSKHKGMKNIALCTLDGKWIFSQKSTHKEFLELDLTFLDKGVYFLFVEGGKGTSVEQIMLR